MHGSDEMYGYILCFRFLIPDTIR